MPYCVHCGKEVLANAKFCQNCGEPLSRVAGDHAVPAQKAGKLISTVWKWTIRLFFGLVTLAGLAFIIVNAIAAASGDAPPTPKEAILWFVGFTYFFMNVSWKSNFLSKHPILSGLFFSFVAALAISASAGIAMAFIAHRP